MACRKTIAVMCQNAPRLWYLDATCMEHSHHLITMGGLTLADKLLAEFGGRNWKYYSSIAMFTNVARANAKELYHTWCKVYGALSGLECVKKLFPRCCSTRWGSIHVSEEMILKAGCEGLRTVLCILFGEKLGHMSKKAEHTNENLSPDALAIEAIAEFQKKMGKWRRLTLDVLGDALFQPVMEAMHRLRVPVMRLSYFLKSKLTPKQVEEDGGHLTALVNFKAAEIFEMFNDLAGPLPEGATMILCPILPQPNNRYVFGVLFVVVIMFRKTAAA